MSALRLTVVLAALSALPALGQTQPSGISFPLTKGGVHLIAINGVVGAGAGSLIFISALTGGPNRDLAVGGSAAVGLLALFLGSGLTAGHLLDPTPPMAWSSFFAGAAGAGLATGLIFALTPFTSFGRGPTFEAVILAMALGYVIASTVDLALPGRDSLSWKDFWVPMVVAILPGAALIVGGLASNAFRSPEFSALVMVYPAASFLITRAILSVVRPFDPWFDDLKPPFRAEPIITFTSNSAMVGLAASW